MDYIDLHVHSTASDGTLSPEELVSYAAQKGLRAFALTDHDTTQGLKPAFQAAAKIGLELIPGIEFSTEYQGRDIHILGLDIDWLAKDFSQALATFQNAREARNQEMADRLRRLEGVDISLEKLRARFPGAVLTRAHYGKYLLEKGYVREIKEAFTRYIGDDCPCFVPRHRISPGQAVQLILSNGGIPVLAHPLLYHMTEEDLEVLVSSLKEQGLLGLEAIYSTNQGMEESHMRRLARRYELEISGGSDFHGSIKPHIDLGTGKGNLRIPYEILERLRASKRSTIRP